MTLACWVPHFGLEITLADGRRAQVSHDPAFAPDLAPCVLARHLGDRPDAPWLAHVVRAEVGGPFVEVLDDADPPIVLSRVGTTAICVFACSAPHEAVADWLRAVDPPGIDTAQILGRLRVDEHLGTALVWLESDTIGPTDLARVARWLAPRVRAIGTGTRVDAQRT